MSEVMRSALAKRVANIEGELGPLAVDPMSPETREAVHRALLAGETHYTDRPGIAELRERIAGALGIGRAKDEVIVTSGESEALFVTLLGLALDAGDVAVAGDACTHRSLFHLMSLNPSSTVAGDAIRLAYSETGAVAPVEGVAFVVNLRDRLTTGSTTLPENAIVIGNLDGLEGLPGCRVGFVSASAELIKSIRSWKQTLSICTAAPSQRAALVVWSARGDAS